MKIFVVSNFPSCCGIQSSRFFYLPKETGFENLAFFKPFAPGNFALFIYLFVNSALNSLLKLGSLSQALMSQTAKTTVCKLITLWPSVQNVKHQFLKFGHTQKAKFRF